MIITFCGHACFVGSEEYEKKILALLEETAGDNPADMFLGGYGGFDSFAYNVCKKYKASHPSVSLIFVTPYITEQYQKNHLEFIKNMYDDIIYPEIENKPKRFAVFYRNRYMVDRADFVIAYVNRSYGGAYDTYKYASGKGKIIFNLGYIK